MIVLAEFFFGNIWHFLGLLILLPVFCVSIFFLGLIFWIFFVAILGAKARNEEYEEWKKDHNL